MVKKSKSRSRSKPRTNPAADTNTLVGRAFHIMDGNTVTYRGVVVGSLPHGDHLVQFLDRADVATIAVVNIEAVTMRDNKPGPWVFFESLDHMEYYEAQQREAAEQQEGENT